MVVDVDPAVGGWVTVIRWDGANDGNVCSSELLSSSSSST